VKSLSFPQDQQSNAETKLLKPREDPNVQTWLDTRLRRMLNATEQFGFSEARIWSKLFEAVRYNVDDGGTAHQQLTTGAKRSIALTASIR
jgi:hypothetical protein